MEADARGPGDTATYACDAGYALVGGSTRTCTPELARTGDAPSCEPLPSCAHPGDSTRVLPQADSAYGFDLDGHDTTEASDPIGCGVPDREDGIDQTFGIEDVVLELRPEESWWDPRAVLGGRLPLRPVDEDGLWRTLHLLFEAANTPLDIAEHLGQMADLGDPGACDALSIGLALLFDDPD